MKDGETKMSAENFCLGFPQILVMGPAPELREVLNSLVRDFTNNYFFDSIVCFDSIPPELIQSTPNSISIEEIDNRSFSMVFECLSQVEEVKNIMRHGINQYVTHYNSLYGSNAIMFRGKPEVLPFTNGRYIFRVGVVFGPSVEILLQFKKSLEEMQESLSQNRIRLSEERELRNKKKEEPEEEPS